MGITTSSVLAKTSLDPSPYAHGVMIGGTPRAGVRVDEYNAMAYSAVWCAIRVISSLIMCCPLKLMRKLPGGGAEEVIDHPLSGLLRNGPNSEMDVKTWTQGVEVDKLLWGNHYGLIDSSRSGANIGAILPIAPDCVNPVRTKSGDLIYEVRVPNQPNQQYAPSEIFHVRGMGPNPLVGWSPIKMARESISLGMAADRFGASFFGNGTTPSMVFQHPKSMSDGAQARFRDSVDAYRNDTAKARGILVVEEDMKVTPVTMPLEDAQFIETRTFQINDIGPRIYSVPPAYMGDYDRAKFSNLEQMDLQLQKGAILPNVIPIEAEGNRKLITEAERAEGYFFRINTDGLLRADTKSRGEFFKIMLDQGVYSRNDILELMDQNPIGPEGDTRLVPMNMVSLETAYREGKTGASAETPNPTKQTNDTSVNNSDTTGRALEPVFRAAIKSLLGKEMLAITRKTEKNPDSEAFAKWMMDFYADHERHIQAGLSPACRALLDLCGLEDGYLEGPLKIYAKTWCEESRDRAGSAVADGQTMRMMVDWSEHREGQLYDRLMIELMAVRMIERRKSNAV